MHNLNMANNYMTAQEAIDNYAEKQTAAKNAWLAVRANRTDIDLDVILRARALSADEKLKEAYGLRTKYAPSV